MSQVTLGFRIKTETLWNRLPISVSVRLVERNTRTHACMYCCWKNGNCENISFTTTKTRDVNRSLYTLVKQKALLPIKSFAFKEYDVNQSSKQI